MRTAIKFIIGIICLAPLVRAGDAPSVRITLDVVTSDGVPVPAAQVTVQGDATSPGKYPAEVGGITDTAGRFTAVIGAMFGDVNVYAQRKGFYPVSMSRVALYRDGSEIYPTEQRGSWEPWDHMIKVIMKPVKSPVVMYTKNIDRDYVPELGVPIGYDLEKGDWVDPYGVGEHTDLEIEVDGYLDAKKKITGEVKLRVPGEYNGLMAYKMDPNSEMKFPSQAPADGYQEMFVWTIPHGPYASPDLEERGFIFRVRSIVDRKRETLRACYGVIAGPITILRGGTASPAKGIRDRVAIGLTYYFNPNPTRDLEFDPRNAKLAGPLDRDRDAREAYQIFAYSSRPEKGQCSKSTVDLCRRAANLGSGPAEYALGAFLVQSPETRTEGFRWLLRADKNNLDDSTFPKAEAMLDALKKGTYKPGWEPPEDE